MSSDYIAYLALLTSIISLVVSFLTLHRDRHVVKARGSIYETTNEPEKWNLSISVSNAGKRPISVSFVTVRPKGMSGISVPFSEGGSVSIEVGGSAVANIMAGTPAALWRNPTEIADCDIFVQDALGKDHIVKI
jgi:hypothetical protein